MVATFQLGATLVDPSPNPLDPSGSKGDPSESFPTPLEQYRTLYVFPAPVDYDVSFVNIVGPPDAGAVLDGVSVPPGAFEAIGASGLGVARRQLVAAGSHRIESIKPVGIQVYGYGSSTSYQVPGGLNLAPIAPAPTK